MLSDMSKVISPDQKTVAFIYLRVSTLRQAAEGVSIDAQESKCRAHAARMGWEVVQVFADEGVSGKDGVEHRPGLAHMLSRVRETPNAVCIVYSVSRLARRQSLLWYLLDERKGAGLSISSATEPFDTTTPTGRAMLGMIAVFAQLEADMVSERTKDALAERKAQGKRLGRKSLKETAPETVKLICQLKDNVGMSQRSIVDYLNAQKIPTPSGRGSWYLTMVQTALRKDLDDIL